MKFYCPGRHQAATQIGAYFALPETIKRYQNEEIEPLGGEQRSRRVALQVLAMFPACGSRCGSGGCPTFCPTLLSTFLQQKSTENRSFRCFLELLGGFEPPTSSLPSDKMPSSRCGIRVCGRFCPKKEEVGNSLLHVFSSRISLCGSKRL
jgi:hypothetical protein